MFGLLLADGPRYAFSKVAMCFADFVSDIWKWMHGVDAAPQHSYCPTVTVLLPGYNEESHFESALRTVWGSYPRLEIIVVDDGSTDRMGEIARRFAKDHAGVIVLRRDRRGGKASAVNFAIAHSTGEVVIIMDGDSHLAPFAIWEIVQPLRDPQVGAVSAAILVDDPFKNLLTWYQAYEYLNNIFIGRMVSARLGILSIVSGAFGAFRRSVLDAGMGNDVGPDEDCDLTLRIRKAGWKIAYAPYAQCYTEVPDTWGRLWNQRCLWDQGAFIRYYCRKHLDIVYLNRSNFRMTNCMALVESIFFHVICLFGIWGWFFWLFLFNRPADTAMLLLTTFIAYQVFELMQLLAVPFYSIAPCRDLRICCIMPLMPVYQLFLFVVRTVAIIQETFWRKCSEHNYVPRHVRDATWPW